MSKWSPIVYGRTYEVDFRLIAMPESFNDESKKWALKHILGTTRSPEKLLAQPRWSLFKNDKYCVVGVTCMAKELLQNSLDEETLDNITIDFTKRRQIYVFVGYVAQLDVEQDLPLIPQYSDKNLEIFQSLYKYVQQRWSVKSYQEESRIPILTEYKAIEYLPTQLSKDFEREYFTLNLINNQIVRLWPEEYKENLWLMAVETIANSQNVSLSLCLGIASQKDALESPFMNVTAFGVRQRDDISRLIEPAVNKEEIKTPPIPPIKEPILIDESSNLDVNKKELPVEPVEIVGALIGGLAGVKITQLSGFFFGGGVVGFVVGAGIGWVVAGCFTNKGIGGKMSRQTRNSVGDSIGTRSKRRGSGSRSRSRDVEQDNFGFRRQLNRSQNSEIDQGFPTNLDEDKNNNSNWFDT